MSILEYRKSFHIYSLSNSNEKSEDLSIYLEKHGFSIKCFHEESDFIESIRSHPPHFILLTSSCVDAFLLEDIGEVSSEINLILLADSSNQTDSLNFSSLFGVVENWKSNLLQILLLLDKGIEINLLTYKNEELELDLKKSTDEILNLKSENKLLEEKSHQSPVVVSKVNSIEDEVRKTEVSFDKILKNIVDLKSQNLVNETIQEFLNALNKSTGRHIIYAKYLFARQSILITHGAGIDMSTARGVGFEIKSDVVNIEDTLKASKKFLKLIEELYSTPHFFILPVVVQSNIKAFVILSGEQNLNESETVLWEYFLKHFELLNVSARMHNLETQDPVSELLNNDQIELRIGDEVSRARRLGLPVSLLKIGIDHLEQLQVCNDENKINNYIKGLAQILKKTSRVNDVLARIGENSFAILLPHTGARGAAIKAEKLRRIVEATDFSKILNNPDQIKTSICIGVSEYPSLCGDAEELKETAEEALFLVRTTTNKVCVAPKPLGYTADFEVPQK